MATKIFASEQEVNDFFQNSQAELAAKVNELKQRKFQGDKDKAITFTFKLNQVKDDRKAVIEFTEKAWVKVQALVQGYTTEIEWHGTVERISEDTFRINDILTFPHEVSGAQVVSDQKEYEAWLDTLDDETFNTLRFHGHSHVNMGVTPSAVDMGYRKAILNNFGTPTETSDLFYIFLIFNKKGDISGEIYDLQNNALYSSDEITVKGCGWLMDFLTKTKSQVRERTAGFKPSYNSTKAPANTTPAAQAKKSEPKYNAKTQAKQTSLLDDDYPDPLDDEYYGYGYPGYYGYGGRR